MTTLAVPAVSTEDRRPLSTHGLPKPPRVTSPGRLHRFSGLQSPPQQTTSSTPSSPGPMSPPMSARSFGTFIDSEPSTPAYSPRMDHQWDSTMVLLRPMSTCSEPSSPTEPAWEVSKAMDDPRQASGLLPLRRKGPSAFTKETFVGTQLEAAPNKRVKPSHRPKPLAQIRLPDVPHVEEEDFYNKANELKSPTKSFMGNSTAPLGKFASKMKLMLRRKSTPSKKKEKKKEKEKDYYDPVEVVHWTEM
jgi:hypothetical protein